MTKTIPTMLVACIVASGPSVAAYGLARYDALSSCQQSAFLAELVQQTQQALKAEGKSASAATVARLSMSDPSGDPTSENIAFYANLEKARESMRRGNRHLHIELVLAITLRDAGAEVPKNLMTLMNDYKPMPCQGIDPIRH